MCGFVSRVTETSLVYFHDCAQWKRTTLCYSESRASATALQDNGGDGPEKDYTCQKRLLIVNWAQIHNQSLTAVVYRGTSRMLHSRKKPQMWLPSLLLSEPNFINEFLELHFYQ